MNANLSPFVNLSSYVQAFLSAYWIPLCLLVLLVFGALLVFGRGKGGAEAAGAQPEAMPATPLPTEPEDIRRALLVVDDSAVARAKLGKLFEGAGYRVELASDGVQALELLAATFFSVLITDLEMPNMNGLELIAAVQGGMETENLPIIAITGHDELQARVHDYQGLYGIFKKPWNDRELLKRVETLASLRLHPKNN